MNTRQARLEGIWEQARGRIREAWGALSDDDIDRAAGRWDQLVGVIRQKSGQRLEQVEDKLEDILDEMETRRPSRSGDR